MFPSLFRNVALIGTVLTSWPIQAQVKTATPPSQPSFSGTHIPPRSNLQRQFSLDTIGRFVRPVAAAEQYRNVIGFARCAASVSPDLSAELLDTDPQSGRAAAISRQLRGISKGCLPAGSFLPTAFFRSALAETLYKDVHLTPTTTARPRSTSSIAECIFVQAPQAVDALFQTLPGSQAERHAFDQLTPLSHNCIVNGEHANIAGVETFLRSELAEVAYRAAVPRSTAVPN